MWRNIGLTATSQGVRVDTLATGTGNTFAARAGGGRYAYKHSALQICTQTNNNTCAGCTHLWGWLSRRISGPNVNIPTPWPAVLLMSRHVSLTAASGHWWLRDQRGMLWHKDQMSRLTPHPTSPQSRRWSDSGVCQENSSRHPTEKIDNILTILFQF